MAETRVRFKIGDRVWINPLAAFGKVYGTIVAGDGMTTVYAVKYWSAKMQRELEYWCMKEHLRHV